MKLSQTLALCVATALPVAACLFKVWVHHDAVQVGYRLSEEEHHKKQLSNAVHQLEVELAAERTPARLLQLAKKLGLTPPAPGQLLAKGGARGGEDGRP